MVPAIKYFYKELVYVLHLPILRNRSVKNTVVLNTAARTM